MTMQETRTTRRRYRELRDDFLSHQFNLGSPEFRELCECERRLIAEGLLKALWAE